MILTDKDLQLLSSMQTQQMTDSMANSTGPAHHNNNNNNINSENERTKDNDLKIGMSINYLRRGYKYVTSSDWLGKLVILMLYFSLIGLKIW